MLRHFELLVYSLLIFATGTQSTYASVQERPDAQIRKLLGRAILEASSFRDRFEAEVWLVDMSRRLRAYVPVPQERIEILKTAHQEANRARLDPQLVLSVIHVESLFERFAISSAGARGLMQVMPFWTNEIGRSEDNLFEIRTNLRYGCTILRIYLDKEKGNLTRALGRYNGSLGSDRYPSKVYRAMDQYWFLN